MDETLIGRREAVKQLSLWVGAGALGGILLPSRFSAASSSSPRWEAAIDRGLQWLASVQSPRGRWVADPPGYPAAMTALSGMALVASGSTATQGPFAKNIRAAVDYLMSQVQPNGLIGDPATDNRYTYGHGFSMLFLSQVLGEEEDAERRQELIDVLAAAVRFSGSAQTRSGGWGYVSAREGSDFDEGSTTITQVQGLRGCRNAGIPVSKQVIEQAKNYIYLCKNPDGGISYSSRNRGTSRPAITAAALASLYNAGDYDSKHVPEMMEYCRKELYNIDSMRSFGHWHYTYLYYAQVVYREGGKSWEVFRDKLYDRIIREQKSNGAWEGNVGSVYVTAINLTILQLEKALLPIYQR